MNQNTVEQNRIRSNTVKHSNLFFGSTVTLFDYIRLCFQNSVELTAFDCVWLCSENTVEHNQTQPNTIKHSQMQSNTVEHSWTSQTQLNQSNTVKGQLIFFNCRTRQVTVFDYVRLCSGSTEGVPLLCLEENVFPYSIKSFKSIKHV